MNKNSIVQDMEISYYGIMSKFAQYKRNLIRKNKSLLHYRAMLKEGIS